MQKLSVKDVLLWSNADRLSGPLTHISPRGQNWNATHFCAYKTTDWKMNSKKVLVSPGKATALTLSPPAVKTQWLSQCQTFHRLVRSSHTLVSWTFDLLNRFSISLACFRKKKWMLFASVRNINTPGQWKESLGQTCQSLCSSFSGRTNATSALSLGVA
jgi:hypothetical protein